jgi:photosystem II stability/assembly factor-like uncharacterized protein
MRRYAFAVATILCAVLAARSAPVRAGSTAHFSPVTSAIYGDMKWRFIGPLRGGRTASITGVADQQNLFYIGAVNGGVWKSDDAGRTWMPIFDGQSTGSIGAIAVAPSNDDVVYVGSGEGMHRPDLSVGDGMYRSRDGGATWTHLGLRDAQQIAAIAVDPHDPNRLFVAALGHPYGPNPQRGVYRSLDGGATFRRVLFTNDRTGSPSVTLDPQNPQTVYATLWTSQEAPWEASFELPGSGIFKSTDGGTTWTQLSNGLPKQIGRTVVAVAPSDSNVVYAMADARPACGFYRSIDGGQHFTLMNDQDNIGPRCGDLSSIAVDPRDENTVWITSTSTYRSTDGGKHFVAVKGAPGGDDYAHIWINPAHPNIIALAADQGATLSVNGGRTWSSWYNQPTGQMFHVAADNRFPYWVCGGQQDSGSACVSSRGAWGEITERDWHTAGAEEYGYVIADPLHPGVFFGGKVERFDERTGQAQEVSPAPLRTNGYRVVRTEPLAFDPLEPQALYFGANQVWVTRDAGMHWRTVSPDLTRPHPALPAIVGPFERGDRQHGTHRGVIYALALSWTHHGTIWAGTDDGLVWLTRDGGGHWANVTPKSLTPWSKISQIDLSRFDDQTAYVAVNRFRLDDLRPYVYVTHDGGASWRLAVAGLPRQPVNAVRADPDVRGLLYAATENGVFVSFDDGWMWQSLQLNLPHTSVRDLIVHGNDLAVATHGRGFWILDDVTPLRDLAAHGAVHSLHLFPIADTIRIRRDVNTDTPLPPETPTGQNPPDGAIVDYFLPSGAAHVRIEIDDAAGQLVRAYSSDDVAPPIPQLDKPVFWARPFSTPPTGAGMHRYVWDLHETPPHSDMRDLPIAAVPHDTPFIPQGALVVPGTYRVKLVVDGRVAQTTLRLKMDPRISMTAAQLDEQYAIAHDLAVTIGKATDQSAAARAAHSAKRYDALQTLEAQSIAMLGIVDDVDAPVPSQARAAFCSLMEQAMNLHVAPADVKARCQ